MNGFIKRSLHSLIAATLIGAGMFVPSGAAIAAERPTTFVATLDSTCIGGLATDNAAVALEWRAANNTLKASGNVAADADGHFSLCSQDANVSIGDSLSATVAGVPHQLTVPDLSMQLDRIGNVIGGHAPQGTTVHLDSFYTVDVVANSQGRWQYATPGDFRGGITAFAHWLSGAGDRLNLIALAPQVIVYVGRSKFSGSTVPWQKTTLTLVGKGKGKATAGAYGFYYNVSPIRSSTGHKITVAAGDHVISDVAADADWIVPQIDIFANKRSNVVKGECHDNGSEIGYFTVHLDQIDEGVGTSVTGVLDANNQFQFDFDDPLASSNVYTAAAADFHRGDRIELYCEQTTGDQAARRIIVR